jgi:hypothetical protein
MQLKALVLGAPSGPMRSLISQGLTYHNRVIPPRDAEDPDKDVACVRLCRFERDTNVWPELAKLAVLGGVILQRVLVQTIAGRARLMRDDLLAAVHADDVARYPGRPLVG